MTTRLDDKQISKNFFNEWIGAKGPKGWFSRNISNTGRWYTNMLIKEGQVKERDKILDVGCGSATTIVNLFNKIALKNRLCAIEPADAQFELAKKNLAEASLVDKVDLRQGFASPLPFDDNSFDLVYSSFTFKHFANNTLASFFKEAQRVLKPGGRFLGWEFAKVTNPIFKKLAKNPKKAMRHFRGFNDLSVFLKKAQFKNIEEFEVKNRGFWDPVEDVGFKAIKADGRQ